MAKSTKVEKAKRIRTVQEWIMDDHNTVDIIRSAVARWDVSERQAERYYSEAFTLFKELTEKSIESKKAYYLQRKKKLIREMDPAFKKTPSGVRAINKVLDSMAKLDGIMIDKLEVTGKDGVPLSFPEVKVTVVHSDVPPFASNENEVDV
ncbi:hypothetical protein FW774_05930 [Pedobacter sp. BS3]|uniref:hypothetical protein n=1 Tax=Pedobacter sp. BS3 TaxID=2567937 RepID=UPI0011EBFD31|nr:hypothetical protein [Pedobacter sp. BS3]TZF84526.1 hypothetical protein FW774_05930 [Pedobacter sp. BS3]